MGASASIPYAEHHFGLQKIEKGLPFATASSDKDMSNKSRRASCSVHDEAHSFRFKAGSLKMLIRNKMSRQAFYSFLEESFPGRDQLLSAFLIFEGIKKETRKDFAVSKNKLLGMITKIESVSSPQNTERGTSGEQIFLITQSLKGAMIVDPIVFTRRICQAQEELLLLMTPSYEAFLESSNFEEYETSMKDQERKTYDQKHVSTRNMTNSSSQTRKSTSSNSITVLSQSAILKQTDIP